MSNKKIISDNRSKSQKEAAKKRPQTWKPGQSGNPKGAPKRGQSWSESVKRIGDMTPSEASAYCLMLAKQLLQLGDGMTLRDAGILASFARLINEPDGRMFNALADRADGKVPQPTHEMNENEWRDWFIAQGYTESDANKAFESMVNAAANAVGANAGTPESTNGERGDTGGRTQTPGAGAVDSVGDAGTPGTTPAAG